MTGRDRILMMVLAVAVVVAGGWFGLVAPKRSESKDLAAQISAAQTQLAEATRQTAEAEAAQKSFGEDAAAVATLGKAVPATDDVASLLYQLDAAAGDSRVKLESITPSTEAAAVPGATGAPGLPAGVTEVSLMLSFTGRFADLQRFLRRAHSSTSVQGEDVRVRGRLLDIRGVDLTPGDDGSVTAAVTAAAFMATPAAAAPATPDPAAPAPEASAATAPPTQPAMIGAGG